MQVKQVTLHSSQHLAIDLAPLLALEPQWLLVFGEAGLLTNVSPELAALFGHRRGRRQPHAGG